MAIKKITYNDKVTIHTDSSIPAVNKCRADDLNQIKEVVNNNADEIPSGDNLVNVGTSVDTDYRTNILYSKNLFDKNNANILNGYFNNSGVISYNGARSIYIKCKPNTSYTIKKDGSVRFRVGTTNVIPNNNVSIIDYVQNDNDEPITITTSNNANYLIVYLYLTSDTNTKTFEQVLSTLQIEKGSTALPYEPYVIPSINVDGEEIYSASKDIISVKMSSDFTLGTTNAYVDIPFPTITEQLGTNFEINSNNQILCKKDGYIKIDCHFNYLTVAASGNKWCVINVYNSSNVVRVNAITLNPYGTQGQRLDISGASRLVQVYAGDTIRSQTYGNASDVLRADYSYITCEYV